jgi:hypothetical protein
MATISNTTYALVGVTLPATSATYDLVPTDLNGNVFEKIYVDVDATNGDVTINLPNISVFGRVFNFELVVTRIDNSLNSVNVVPFASVVPLIQQYIGSATLSQIATRYESLVLSPVNDNGWASESTGGGSVSIPATVGGLVQANLSLAQYVDAAVGTIYMVVDYNATGTGCTLVKTTLANGDYQDWFILASDGIADTGAIGTNPI